METLLLWNEQLDLFSRWLFGNLYGTWWVPIIWIVLTLEITVIWITIETMKAEKKIKELEEEYLKS